MNHRGRTYVRRKLSANDRHPSYTQQVIMDDRSSTQSFPNLHHHRHRRPFHLTLPSLQSPEVGYPSSQPSQDPLEQYGSRGEESTNSFPTSHTSPGGRMGSSGGDNGLLNASGLDGDANMGGHLDGESSLGSHFADAWYGSSKKGAIWEDGESCDSPADDFYSKGDRFGNANNVFYPMNSGSEEGIRRKLIANHNNYAHVSYEAKNEEVYNREANVSDFTKQSANCNRSAAGSYSDSSVDYCRTDSRVSDNYIGREEDYGSSCGSGEDQLQSAAEVEGPWLNVSPLSQTGEGRWRGTADNHTLAQTSPMGIGSTTYTQKLDSFSEAFLSQRKRRFPMVPNGDSSGQMWQYGAGCRDSHGLVKSRHSCAFDSSSSSPPAHPFLPSFPSPPASSHLTSSVLSPPPTPLPPPSHSPSKMDSPVALSGTGHPVSQGTESIGALQFFASHLQSLPSVHSPGMIWKFPLLSHSFPQPSGDHGNIEGNFRSSHGSEYGNITCTASQDILQSPKTFLNSTSTVRSIHPARALCPYNTHSAHSSFHLPSNPSHLSGQHYEAAEKIAPPTVTPKEKYGPGSLTQLQPQQQVSSIYTGTPFPSILHSSNGQKRGHYTPRPLLNPVRRGLGLYSTFSSLHQIKEEKACVEEDNECGVVQCVNVGHDFQAKLPPFRVVGEGWSPEEESPREQLLWKPLKQLEESANLQDQVEKLLSMCSSSCLPGGGSNTELALHCLHYSRGNTMVTSDEETLEMLLFSQPSITGDYHYSGSDLWTDSERCLFSEALGMCGKDFSLIQKLVRTKNVCQCVEFYYLSKKLLDKQKKQEEEENRSGEMEQQKSITPICQPLDRQFGLEEAVPIPPLASFFPCKLCGKMFYKIKSRNAHMKIHRQPQEDWTDRRLQHQLLTQRLALSHPTNLVPNPGNKLLQPQAPALCFSSTGLPGMSSTNSNNADNVLNSVTNRNARVLGPSTLVTYSNITASNSHTVTATDGGDSNQREPATIIPFHQAWGSFGHGTDPAVFYCNVEGKDDVGTGTVGGREPINWQ